MGISDDKYSDEIYKINKNDEGRVTNDIEVLKLVNWVRRKIQTIVRNNMMK